MAGGRPKLYDKIKIGKEIVEYAKSNKLCFTVPQVAQHFNLLCGQLHDWAYDDKEFSVYYKELKQIISNNRLQGVIEGTLDKSIYHRGAGLYDECLNRYEREEKSFEIECKAKKDAEYSKESDEKLTKLCNVLNNIQTERKKARSKIKSE